MCEVGERRRVDVGDKRGCGVETGVNKERELSERCESEKKRMTAKRERAKKKSELLARDPIQSMRDPGLTDLFSPLLCPPFCPFVAVLLHTVFNNQACCEHLSGQRQGHSPVCPPHPGPQLLLPPAALPYTVVSSAATPYSDPFTTTTTMTAKNITVKAAMLLLLALDPSAKRASPHPEQTKTPTVLFPDL